MIRTAASAFAIKVDDKAVFGKDKGEIMNSKKSA